MSLFGFGGFNRGSRFDREEREARHRRRHPADEKEGPIYKILTNVAIIGLFLAVGILVAGIVSQSFTRWTTLALLIVAVLCLGLILVLPWVRKIENKKNIALSWTFLGFTGVCVILWIVSAILIILIYDKVDKGTITDSFGIGCIIFFQIALVISLQFVLAQVVASTVIRYKKKFMPFQVVMYMSYAFADFWLTALICCIYFDASSTLALNSALAAFLFMPGMYTIFAVALVYCSLSNFVINEIEKKRYFNSRVDAEETLERHAELLNKEIEMKEEQQKQSNQSEKSNPKERLEKLKAMLDEGLITEEEFNKKREEVLKDL